MGSFTGKASEAISFPVAGDFLGQDVPLAFIFVKGQAKRLKNFSFYNLAIFWGGKFQLFFGLINIWGYSFRLRGLKAYIFSIHAQNSRV